ncbi:hypothetical protein AVEN_31376-1 [Araneus ventricosus]|uniref:Uncharacterized protein n=1 Tax=Araneus ventricosus TaxID=182803 RepID=A0A4Y2FYZ8_ARAVE|nr:hypothetical protein AVEN_31376-1 [Araneus ventricosus]
MKKPWAACFSRMQVTDYREITLLNRLAADFLRTALQDQRYARRVTPFEFRLKAGVFLKVHSPMSPRPLLPGESFKGIQRTLSFLYRQKKSSHSAFSPFSLISSF